MNLGEMRTEARNIFGETDSANSAISEATLNTWANEAYRFICTKLETMPIVTRKYTTGATITLNSNRLTIEHARILLAATSKLEQLAIVDMDEIQAVDPNWENASTGVPTHLVITGSFSASLYPPPDASHNAIAEGLWTDGPEFKALSTDLDSPDLPLNMHDLFPHYMAYRAFSRLQDPARSGMELALVNSLLKSQKHITTKFSDRRGWRFMESDA